MSSSAQGTPPPAGEGPAGEGPARSADPRPPSSAGSGPETSTGPDAVIRSLLATAPVREPGAERVRRWQAIPERLPAPRLDDPALPPPTVGRGRSGTGPTGRGWTAGLPRAALVAAAVTALALVGHPSDSYLPGPHPGGADAVPLVLTRNQLSSATLSGHDLGPLADPATRQACLARVGVRARLREPLAGRPVVLDGESGILLALPTDRVGRIRLVVVDPACGAGGARVLADQTVGR